MCRIESNHYRGGAGLPLDDAEGIIFYLFFARLADADEGEDVIACGEKAGREAEYNFSPLVRQSSCARQRDRLAPDAPQPRSEFIEPACVVNPQPEEDKPRIGGDDEFLSRACAPDRVAG